MSVHCPGCAFGFWRSWGEMARTRPTNVDCVSGSALAGVVYLCNLNVEEQLDLCAMLRPRTRFWTFYATIRLWLDIALPADCAQLCNGRLRIFLRKLPCFEVVVVDEWRDKKHLVDTLIACISWFPVGLHEGLCMDAITVRTHLPVLPTKTVWYLPTRTEAKSLYDGSQSEHL